MKQASNSFVWNDFRDQVETIVDLDPPLLKDRAAYTQTLETAFFYKRKYLRISLDILLDPEWPRLRHEAQIRNFSIILQWQQEYVNLLPKANPKAQGISLLQILVSDTPRSLDLTKIDIDYYLTLIINRRNGLERWFLQQSPSLQEKIFFRFEFPQKDQIDFLSCGEIHRFLLRCQKKKIQIQPDPGTSVSKTHFKDEELFPNLMPILETKSPAPEVKISVIIPTFNNKYFLLNVLKHLLDQKYPDDRYEIIVVDDGSVDETLDYISINLIQRFEKINFRYFRWPKTNSKIFRAGHARNLGAYHAQGASLLFLDSDMILPEQFLSELDELLKSQDVIQSVRHHLYPEQSTSYIRYSDIKDQETYIEEEGYWLPFFKTQSWSDLNFYWKYTCTYCLAVKKDLFLSIGGFRRAYTSYGFEDTELGLKLAQKGARFYLHKTICYHLTKKEKFLKNKFNYYDRQAILAQTSKIFLRNNPYSEILSHFHLFLMEDSLWYWRLRHNLKKGFQILIRR